MSFAATSVRICAATSFGSPTKQRNSVVALVTVAGFVLLLFHRNATLFLSPQMWAEDLIVYFVDHRIYGAKAILEPYAGYIQLSCRLVAYFASQLPDIYTPVFYAWSFLLSIFVTACITYTSPLFKGWEKAFASLALVAVPTSSEVFFGMCYIHWIMAPLVGLALAENILSTKRAASMSACFAMVGLSSPFTLMAAPLIAIKLITERSLYSLSLALITGLCALFHFQYMTGRIGLTAAGNTVEKLSLAPSIFHRWALGGGNKIDTTLAIAVGTATALLIVWHILSTITVAFRPKFYLLSYGIVFLIVGCLSTDPSVFPNQFGPYGRYFYVPIVLFIWAYLIVEQQLQRRYITIPATAAILGIVYYNHANRNSDQYLEDNWIQLTKCLKNSEECFAIFNPRFLGKRAIVTDHQLKTLSLGQLTSFRNK